MSKVNFVSEFNLFMRYARDNSLSLRARMLWIALFYIANDRATFNEQTQEYEWPDGFIQVSNGELNLYCCLDKRAIETLRNELKQRGLIDFQPGQKNKRNPAYKINYLSVDVGYKKVPNDVPNRVPNDTPNTAPNDVPNTAPSHVPTHTESEDVLGTKMHPTMPPYSKYKETDINHSQMGCRAKADARERTYHSERNGNFRPNAQDDIGFVNLASEGMGCGDFVPLPWEEVGM